MGASLSTGGATLGQEDRVLVQAAPARLGQEERGLVDTGFPGYQGHWYIVYVILLNNKPSIIYILVNTCAWESLQFE